MTQDVPPVPELPLDNPGLNQNPQHGGLYPQDANHTHYLNQNQQSHPHTNYTLTPGTHPQPGFNNQSPTRPTVESNPPLTPDNNLQIQNYNDPNFTQQKSKESQSTSVQGHQHHHHQYHQNHHHNNNNQQYIQQQQQQQESGQNQVNFVTLLEPSVLGSSPFMPLPA